MSHLKLKKKTKQLHNITQLLFFQSLSFSQSIKTRSQYNIHQQLGRDSPWQSNPGGESPYHF